MRKSVLVIIAAFWLSGCAGVRALPPEQLAVRQVLDVPGMTKERLYAKSKLWIARNFKPFKAIWLYRGRTAPVLEYENEKEGILIATGAANYPNTSYSWTEGYKNYWEVTFTMEEDIKDGGVMVTFDNLGIYVPQIWCQNRYGGWMGAYDKPLTAAEDMAAVRPVLTSLAEKLGEFLRAPENMGNW